MVRWKLAELLKKRGMTAYKLVMASELAGPIVYRIAKPGVEVRRVDGDTLDALCKALECQPGDLLEYVTESEKARPAKAARRGRA